MNIMNEISEHIQYGKAKKIKELVQKAINDGFSAKEILENGLLVGMDIIGGKFKDDEVFVPEVLVAARAMNVGMTLLKPLLQENSTDNIGKVCIGTVRGDLHDIGKNLVKMMLEGKGIEVVDIGTDVHPDKFLETAVKENCKIVLCSALLTTTLNELDIIVKKFEEAGLRKKIKIMIGGAPVTQKFCSDIGADYYTVDAASAADKAFELLTI